MKTNLKKTLLIALSMALVCVISVMGTLAYLTDKTEAVTNTFTAAGLVTDTFELKEKPLVGNPGSYTLGSGYTETANSYKVIPGDTLPKDPKITIKGLEVDAYLFLEVKSTLQDTIAWTLGDGWTALTGKTGPQGGELYYRTVAAGDHGFNLIKDNKLTVASTYTKPASGDEQLIFNAYLVQSVGFASADAAWTGAAFS